MLKTWLILLFENNQILNNNSNISFFPFNLMTRQISSIMFNESETNWVLFINEYSRIKSITQFLNKVTFYHNLLDIYR